MDVLVVGGHGKIALRLLRLLAARGHRARGLIRRPEQAADIEAAGAIAVLGDLEAEASLEPYVRGADAVVFAAGAGPGSGAERKQTVDLGGAVKLADAATALGVRRYVMVSSIGADRPEAATGAMRPYLEAKAAADRYLVARGLDHTIVRPGSLTGPRYRRGPDDDRVRRPREGDPRRRGSGPRRGAGGAEHHRGRRGGVRR
jgi:uncharacterized protein YbjT (DUF2867 family)